MAHPYDGHGIVASIAIRGGRAFFRSKFVETAECVPCDKLSPAVFDC